MMWAIKVEGQSWNWEYLREEILAAKNILFLEHFSNTLDATKVCILHVKAMLPKFLFGEVALTSEWPGSSSDLNAVEHWGGGYSKERRWVPDDSGTQTRPIFSGNTSCTSGTTPPWHEMGYGLVRNLLWSSSCCERSKRWTCSLLILLL